MKKSSIIPMGFATLLLTLFPIASHGDGLSGAGTNPKTKDSIYLEAGWANTQWNSGFQFGAGYGFGLDRNFYMVLSTQYYSSSQNFMSSDFNNGNAVIASYDVWTILASLRVNFTDRDNPVVFYGIAGCGPGLLMRGSSPYFSSATVWESMSRLGIGIDVRLFKRVSFSFEEGFVFQFAGLPFNPYGASNNLGSPDYPTISLGLNLDPF